MGLFLFGCGLRAPIESVDLPAPATWASASSGSEGKISAGWLDEFSDKAMKKNVYKALDNNYSLKVSAANLREAKQDTIITRARRIPSLNAGGSGSLSDGSAVSRNQSYGLNISASWEPDLWGRLRDLEEVAESNERGAIADFRGARLSLAINAARAYVNLVSAQQEVDLARFTMDSFQKNLQIVERTYKATGEGALDVQFARTNVSSTGRTLEAALLDLKNTARVLEVLQGEYPAGLLRGTGELPDLAKRVPAGLPADLVERRPDLAIARESLFASAKLADSARKNLLPDFGFNGSSSTGGSRLSDLLNVDFLISQISSSVSQLIFDGGATRADARASLDANDAFVNQYAQLALEAFEEVEVALAADKSLGEQERFLKEEVGAAARAEKQSERDYAEGINTNILSVLEAQRRANVARAGLINLRNQRLQNRFDLHLALGGDYRTEPR